MPNKIDELCKLLRQVDLTAFCRVDDFTRDNWDEKCAELFTYVYNNGEEIIKETTQLKASVVANQQFMNGFQNAHTNREKEMADLQSRLAEREREIERLQYLHEVVLGITELDAESDDINHSDFELYDMWRRQP